MKTNIEWATHVWNPVTGCNKVSPGCKNCYAERMHKRLKGMKQAKYQLDFNQGAASHYSELERVKDFPAGSRVFVNSMSDLFHENIVNGFIVNVFEKMLEYDNRTYIVLTKRNSRMLNWFRIIENHYPHLYKALTTAHHIWIGVSIENQEYADKRIPDLLRIPMPVKILSCEPLLGPLDLLPLLYSTENRISWVIVGGESGKGARPMHPDWVLTVYSQCKLLNIPFFFKQWGEWVCNIHKPVDTNVSPNVTKHTFGSGWFSTDVYRIGKKKAGNRMYGVAIMEFPNVMEEQK